MAQYQNIFTQVQVQGPPELGMAGRGPRRRADRNARFSRLIGLVGNAQLGPIYLGTFGLDLARHRHHLVRDGRPSFWHQVDCNPALFLRELFWLALEPPRPNTACPSRRWARAATT